MRRLAACGLLALGITGCSGADTSWRADLLRTDAPAADGASVELGAGITARFGADCGQIEIDDVRTACVAWGGDNGTITEPLRVGDTRIVWTTHKGTDQDDARLSAIDHAVVWSDRSPTGRRIDAAVAGDLQQLAWVLEDGEEAWGMQFLDARGRVVAVQHLGGLGNE